MEKFLLFSKYVNAYIIGIERGIVTDVPSKDFIDNLKKCITESRLFSITEETKKLLLMTNPPNKNEPLHLPYNNIFVDVSFTKEEALNYGFKIDGDITGIVIMKGNLILQEEGTAVGEGMRTTFFINTGERVVFQTDSNNLNIQEKYKKYNFSKTNNSTEKISARTKRFVHQFSVNLINLVNDPEVILVHREEDSERNIKRLQRGKIPIPSSTNIRLDGTRKKYVDSLISGNHFSLSYAFFVRGHWRKLSSPRYKEARGRKLWILPFKKGEGILVEKDYRIETEKR